MTYGSVFSPLLTPLKTAPIDTKPSLLNFKKTVSDYLAWEVSNLLKRQQEDSLGK